MALAPGAKYRRDWKGQGSVQRAAGGREIDVTAVVLVQAGTSALAVRQGVEMSPKNHAGGGPHRPGSCSTMGRASQRQRRADAGSEEGEAGVGERPVSGEEDSLQPQMVLPGSA